jgi:5-hydroxyisourate hydrolase-like protein (transthyretin family)
MQLPARALIILALFLGCAAQGFSQTPSAKQPANASVAGKVTIKGKPAAGVVVGMLPSRPDQSSSTFKGTTNQDGVYRINNVSNGNYQIMPVAPAMVVSDLSSPRGTTVIITGPDNVDGIDFDMVPGGVITGKITDADDHPLVETSVTLVAVEQPNERSSNYTIPRALSDDRGIYRIFGIRAGHYKVLVGQYGGAIQGRQGMLPVTYYPDVREPEKAAVVDVDEGSEAANIDIKVGPPTPSFSVSGRVVDEAGNPAPNISIAVSKTIRVDANRTTNAAEGTEGRSDQQGQFRLTNVHAGKYQLSVYPGDDSDLQAQAPVSLEVVDADVTDLVVKVVRGALVSGTIVVEGARKPAMESQSRGWIMVYTKNEGTPGSSVSWARSVRVKPDGSFVAGGVRAGTVSFSVFTGDGKSGGNLTRIERDGVVVPNAILIQGTDHVTGLRLFVTYSSGSISGLVKIVNGTLPAGARISVQITKSAESEMGFGIGSAEVDARGRFLLEGLAAGTYDLTVISYVPNTRTRPPMTKQAVTVTDGTVTELTVTLDLTPPPIP